MRNEAIIAQQTKTASGEVHQARFSFNPEVPSAPPPSLTVTRKPQSRVNLTVAWTPFWPQFFGNLRDVFRQQQPFRSSVAPGRFWPDVFVERPLPWKNLAQSGVAHVLALAMLYSIGDRLFERGRLTLESPVNHSQITYYPIEEFLPAMKPLSPLPRTARPMQGEPEFAKQEIISVPAEPDNSTQTIVNPPHPRIVNQAAPLPNMVVSAPSPAPKLEIPVDLPKLAIVKPQPAAEPQRALDLLANIPQPEAVAPPTETPARSLAEIKVPAPMVEVIEPPKIEAAVASSVLKSIDVPQPEVVPPPTAAPAMGVAERALGQLVALNVRPAAPEAEIKVPDGSRSGIFAAAPAGKPGAPGLPEIKAAAGMPESTASDVANTLGGLTVGTPARKPVSNSVVAAAPSQTVRPDAPRMVAMNAPSAFASLRRSTPSLPPGPTVQDDAVFGRKRVYSMQINLPNLTSAGGSWIVRFAERDLEPAPGDLSTPVAITKVDPAYPGDLIRQRVEGMVTLYAVIRVDGRVAEVRVLHGFHDRLDANARRALERWVFRPATKNGAPVELEAVVRIPFVARRASF